MQMPPRIPLAALSSGAATSLFAFGSVGAAVCRTALLAPALWGRQRPERRTISLGTLGAFVAMILLLLLLAQVGVDELPNWVKVPPTVVTAQGIYTMVMTILIPDSSEASVDLGPADLAATVFGVMAFPATALFVVVMTAASVLS